MSNSCKFSPEALSPFGLVFNKQLVLNNTDRVSVLTFHRRPNGFGQTDNTGVRKTPVHSGVQCCLQLLTYFIALSMLCNAHNYTQSSSS